VDWIDDRWDSKRTMERETGFEPATACLEGISL
jgi:hypothetical protein